MSIILRDGTNSGNLAKVDASGNQYVYVAGGNDNPSVSVTGSPAPGSGTFIAFQSGANLVGVSALNPLPVVGVAASAQADYQAPRYANAAMVNLSADLLGNLRIRTRSETILGDISASPRVNQVEVNFSTPFDFNLVTNTTSGGGSAVQGSGMATYSTSTSPTALANGISVQQLVYRPGHEWYAYFTAIFTTPTDSLEPNHQRIGPFSVTDGFYIGFEQTTFCITQRQNSVDDHTPKSSFNGDPADGSTGSGFTFLGAPVALDFTKINIYRIHGTWFGTGPTVLDVFSPDGNWVTLNTLLYPNTLETPSTYTTTWNMQVEVSKTGSDTTNLSVGTPCWAMGTLDATEKITSALTDYSLAQTTRAVISGRDGSGVYHNVSTDELGHLNVNVAASGEVDDDNNTTSTPLLANAVFTGAPTLVSPYATVRVGIKSDQNSAPSGLSLQFGNGPDPSTPPVNWDYIANATYIGGTGITTPSGVRAEWFRVVYTNGPVDQTYFRLHTDLLPLSLENTKRFLQDPPTSDQLAILTQSALVGQAVVGSGSTWYNVTVDPYGRFNSISTGVLNDLIVGERYNQIEADFSQPSWDNGSVTTSVSGTGSAAQSPNGDGVFATGTGTTGEATGVSVQSLNYRSGAAIYSMWTASFTAPTDSVDNNYQRIGIYDSMNGFYIGYEQTTFYISWRRNSVDTHFPRADWEDPLDGSAGSRFTRNGLPEAVVWTNYNLFRVSYAWLGSSPISYEIMSPDGFWVVVYKIQYPNTATVPQLTNPDTPMTVDVLKFTSDSTNLTVATGCWAAGLTINDIRLNDVVTDLSLAPLSRAIIAGKDPAGNYQNVALTAQDALTVGYSGLSAIDAVTWDSSTPLDTALVMVNDTFEFNTVAVGLVGSGLAVGSPPSNGEITFEVSIDGSHWIGLTGVNAGLSQTMTNANFDLVDGTTALIFNNTGFAYFRARLNDALSSGQVVISYTLETLASSNSTTTISTGTINVASNQGNPNTANNAWPTYVTVGGQPLTANSATTVGKFAADTNIVSVLGTAPTTPGFLNVLLGGTATVQPAGATIWEVAPTASANTKTNPFFFSETDGTNVETASMAPWGTKPTGTFINGVNAELFVGINAVSTFAPVPVSATTSQNTSGNPIFVQTVAGSVAAVTNPILSEMTFTNFGSPAEESLNVYVVNPLTATFTETQIGVTQVTSPWVVSNSGIFSVQDSTAEGYLATIAGAIAGSPPTPIHVTGTVVGTLTNNNAASDATNFGVLVAQANATAQTWTEGNQVLLSTTLNGHLRVGTKTDNNAAPTANTNVGALPALANAATPTAVTEGNQVLLSTDLSRNLRTSLISVAGVTLGATAVTNFGTAPAAAAVQGVNASLFAGTTALTQTSGSLNINITGSSGTSTVAGSLTNNNAAPAATLIGVLPAIAETAYATVTYTTGDQVLPVTDLHGALNVDWQALAGTALGGPTDWGTAPATSIEVQGVNAELFVGQNAVSATAPVPVSATAAANASGNPIFVETVSGSTTAVTGSVGVTQSTSPWVVSGGGTAGSANTNVMTVQGINGGVAVPVTLTSTTITGTVAVDGALTNNNAAPAATLIGVLPAIAETAYTTVTYTTGDMVLPVTDLHGALNYDLQAVGGTAVVAAAAGIQKVGISGATGATLDAVTTAATAPANGIATLVEYNGTIPALTTGQSIAAECDTTGGLYVNNEGRKRTYSCFASFTPAAGDISLLPGNATTVVRIHRVEVSLSTTGTAGVEQVQLVKRSAADTGGTSASMTIVPHDSAFAAADSVPLNYTTAPTLGAAVGAVRGVQFFDESASTTGANTWLWTFGDGRGGASCIVLRGTAQTLAINISGVVATQTVTVSFEWTEE